MRAIRYREEYASIIGSMEKSFNPLCVQLDIEQRLLSILVVRLCNVSIRYACN